MLLHFMHRLSSITLPLVTTASQSLLYIDSCEPYFTFPISVYMSFSACRSHEGSDCNARITTYKHHVGHKLFFTSHTQTGFAPICYTFQLPLHHCKLSSAWAKGMIGWSRSVSFLFYSSVDPFEVKSSFRIVEQLN